MPAKPVFDRVVVCASGATKVSKMEKRACLVFTSLNKDKSILSEKVLRNIAESKRVKLLFGSWYLISCDTDESDFPRIIVSADFEHYILRHMGKGTEEEIYLVNDGSVQRLNLDEVYYGCRLPEKHILGCEGCLKKSLDLFTSVEPADNTCDNRCLAFDILHRLTVPDQYGLEKTFRTGKGQIAGFTTISSSTTNEKAFVKSLRVIDDHDFSVVLDKIEFLSSRRNNQQHTLNFIKEACAECLMQPSCFEGKERIINKYLVRYCQGAYPPPEQIAKDILSQVSIPYTKKQLDVLLANAGTEYTRDRKKWITTFSMVGKQLQYVQRRVVRPHAYSDLPFGSYEEACDCIWERNNHLITAPCPDNTFKRNDNIHLALLCAVASLKNSPIRYGSFRTTNYPALYLESWSTRGFRVHFRQVHSHRTLPWGMSIKDFQDIFSLYTRVPYANQIPHPQRIRRY